MRSVFSAAPNAALALLSAGVKDEAIARQLGVGLRTVERQVRRLMDAFHVRTRFQLGQAVERSKCGPAARAARRARDQDQCELVLASRTRAPFSFTPSRR